MVKETFGEYADRVGVGHLVHPGDRHLLMLDSDEWECSGCGHVDPESQPICPSCGAEDDSAK